MKNMLRLLLLLIALPLCYVLGNVVLAYVTQLRPALIEEVKPITSPAPTKNISATDSVLTFMIWNIGYGGLGAETDFFYDGGKMVITPEAWVKRYQQGIDKTLVENSDADFILLQEVDRDSKRSWHIDQALRASQQLPQHTPVFTLNYNVKYIPFPWTEPLGKVYGGLLSLSRFSPIASQRIALPNITDFPRRLFYLKRCLLVLRFPLPNGKELVVINTHYEAYDDGGVKRKQMAITKTLVETEYAKGNYVIIGGDWNIAPPDFDVHKWEKEKLDDPLYCLKNDPNYITGWQYAYDSLTPTNRKNNHAFDTATSFTTVIDYFYCSPNIEVLETKGIDANFRYSDHNPVRMKVRLK